MEDISPLNWFDSPYYQILYAHRDESEAAAFIDRILEVTPLPAGSRVLDAGCGNGRHALHLHSRGLNVDAIDSAPSKISQAKKMEQDGLRFELKNFSSPGNVGHYDAVFSFFTSFGFGNTENENVSLLHHFEKMLRPGGMILIDYMNSPFVLANLVKKESIEAGNGIRFEINRGVCNHQITKSIFVCDQEKQYKFEEKVMQIGLDDFRRYFRSCHLALTHVFGDYSLNPFVENHSERLILIGRKR